MTQREKEELIQLRSDLGHRMADFLESKGEGQDYDASDFEIDFRLDLALAKYLVKDLQKVERKKQRKKDV